jgi:hypothetical protein
MSASGRYRTIIATSPSHQRLLVHLFCSTRKRDNSAIFGLIPPLYAFILMDFAQSHKKEAGGRIGKCDYSKNFPRPCLLEQMIK